jgi:flavorubredoxin
MSFLIKNNVYWVGKVDWELRKFHGEELSTEHGSSYNAYLIKDEKNVLIDSVYTPFAEEFIDNLEKEIDLNTIDYVIVNHAEPDHSGALPYLMKKIPNAEIFCTANGIKSIKGYYHQDWNFTQVKTGDRLNIGSRELVFVENQMIHWPDSMMCYLTGDNILFSNDAFGQHYAHDKMFNSQCDKAVLEQEAIKYYANIVAPFSKKVAKKLEEVKAMNLQIDYICPSHGVMWDENPAQIIETYDKWANAYAENQVTLFFDSMYHSTRKMAEAIAEGILEAKPSMTVKLFNAGKADKSDIVTEIFRAKAVLVGSPTVNNGISTSVAGILDEIIGFAFQNKRGGAFGSYGWSPAGVKIIANKLNEAGIEMIGDGVKAQWNPTQDDLNKCRAYGRQVAESIQ